MQEARSNRQDQLVSIIIPVYNKVAFVRETLDSALRQTYANTEIILVDDGSTDGSFEILKEYWEKYPEKVQLIDQENQGVSSATNTGIQAAKGGYIQFLDADDLLSPDKIQLQMDLIKSKPNGTIASCEWVSFFDSTSSFQQFKLEIFRDYHLGIDMLLDLYNRSEMMQPGVFLIPRSVIQAAGPWNENLSINQDGEFFCRVLLQCKGICFERQAKVYYRMPGESNVSQQKSYKASASLLESYRCYEREILKMEDSKRVREAIARNFLRFGYVTYPNYPDLLEEAKRDFKRMGVDKSVRIGGPKFQLITKFLGFDQAMKLKRFFH